MKNYVLLILFLSVLAFGKDIKFEENLIVVKEDFGVDIYNSCKYKRVSFSDGYINLVKNHDISGNDRYTDVIEIEERNIVYIKNNIEKFIKSMILNCK